jgi:hypothetical protein
MDDAEDDSDDLPEPDAEHISFMPTAEETLTEPAAEPDLSDLDLGEEEGSEAAPIDEVSGDEEEYDADDLVLDEEPLEESAEELDDDLLEELDDDALLESLDDEEE